MSLMPCGLPSVLGFEDLRFSFLYCSSNTDCADERSNEDAWKIVRQSGKALDEMGRIALYSSVQGTMLPCMSYSASVL